MTIQDVGAVGELIAAVATVATLLYLAVQIRQNTATNRSNSAASQNQADLAVMLLLAQDADASHIFFEGLADPSALSDADVHRLDALIRAQLANCEQAWRFSNENAIDQDQWTAQVAFLRWISQQPGFTRYWPIWKSSHPVAFQKVVNQAMTETSAIPVALPTAQPGTATERAVR